MRAIIVMFDSLNRRMLPPYGDTRSHAPNFARLAERSVTFDTCYAGSMPCMPARRELHTGRYNFLHRSWGPIEPFDDSMPEMLAKAGVYTHLITDHQHYWEDGGATYHTRYSSHEFFRGQEGDLWKGRVGGQDRSRLTDALSRMHSQDRINRDYLRDEADHPQTLTFDAGLHFLQTNADQQDWMVQIETFDPHEPFFSYDGYHKLFPDDSGNDAFDWPPYGRVTEAPGRVARARNRYLALLAMCDRNLGRVLDLMDAQQMWSDTMLIVCTDHGYMLGERGWWAKSVMPWYDETIHTPLFVWDPRAGFAGERRRSLVQTIDIAPTLLEFFGLPLTPDMQGRPLAPVLASDTPLRAAGLFGSFGGHVSVTDGRYVYMRACAAGNAPLEEHTLMPTHMRSRFEPHELAGAELVGPLSFTKGAPVLRMPGWTLRGPEDYGTLLYDLGMDPAQEVPLDDPALELRMIGLLLDQLRASDAPPGQYARLGLPQTGPAGPEHLLVARQWPQVLAGQRRAATVEDFAPGARIASVPVDRLLADPAARTLLVAALPMLAAPRLPSVLEGKTLLEIAGVLGRPDRPTLDKIEAALSAGSAA